VITRAVRLQLVAFLLVTALGVGYAGFRYAGFGDLFGATTYPVRLQLAQSGGIFTGADVTYRGVSVGRVGPLTLIPDGVEARLDINRDAPPIPADLDAAVHNLSAIGEQYVDLQPAGDGGPLLDAGSVIPMSRTSTPVPIEDLVVSLDDFVRSVPLDSLRTVVDQLGDAFEGTAQPLQKILDTTNAFTADAVDALPQTLALIHDGRTVLTTQNDVSGDFKSFSHDLSLLADLLTVSRVAEPRQDGLRQLLVTYPGLAANGYTAVPDDGTAHLGLAVNLFDPFPCTQGYEDTPHRSGSEVGPVALNEDAYCAEPPGSPINVRGAQNVPRAATPMPPANAPVGPPGPLPAGSAPVDSAPPLSSLAQILLS
jgi:phospholipid/cholesterol/gamma-HCH transport system substrate-binding protein